MKKLALAIALLSTNVFASTDADSYCAYLEKKAEADKLIMRYPDVIVRFSKAEYGNAPIVLMGLQQSMNNYAKANITDQIKDADCALYRATQDADNEVKYAILKMDKATLEHKLEFIAIALNDMGKIILAAKDKLKNGSTTVQVVTALEDKQKIMLKEQAATKEALARIQLPASVNTDTVSIADIIESKKSSEHSLEQAKNDMEKTKHWDVQIQAGEGNNLDTGKTGPFVGLNVRYNIASWSHSAKLDEATNLHDQWKANQEVDSIVGLKLVKQQVEGLIASETANRDSLVQILNEVESKINNLSASNSDEAVNLKTVQQMEQLIVKMQYAASEFRLSKLETFIKE